MPLPRCAKCGEPMTPANARIRPELFLHDKCLPAYVPAQAPNELTTAIRQAREAVERLRQQTMFFAGSPAERVHDAVERLRVHDAVEHLARVASKQADELRRLREDDR